MTTTASNVASLVTGLVIALKVGECIEGVVEVTEVDAEVAEAEVILYVKNITISINIVFLICSLFSRIYVHVERLYLTLVGTYVTACLQKLYSK